MGRESRRDALTNELNHILRWPWRLPLHIPKNEKCEIKQKAIPDPSSWCVEDCAGWHHWSWSPRQSNWPVLSVWRARRIFQRHWRQTCAARETAPFLWRRSRFAAYLRVFRVLHEKRARVKKMINKLTFSIVKQWLKQVLKAYPYRERAGWHSCRTGLGWVFQYYGEARSKQEKFAQAYSAPRFAG